MLLQPPPRPATDARLTRFTNLLDTLTAGEAALAAARRFVEQSNPAAAERDLTDFIPRGQQALEHAEDLPVEYVELLGQTLARSYVARAAARVEQALSGGPAADVLLRAAQSDADAAHRLPAAWLDHKTRTALARLEHILAPTT